MRITLVTALLLLTPTLPIAAEERTIEWSGHKWVVKATETPYGPGPNFWSDSEKSVWVDAQGRLNLKVRQINGQWQCAEVYSEKSFGYGKYIFYLDSRVDNLDRNVAVGLFVHGSDRDEIDIEFSKWTRDVKYAYSQYVLQPRVDSSNINRTEYRVLDPRSTHGFSWSRAGVGFRSYVGHDIAGKKPIKLWNYTGIHNPTPAEEKVHINVWLYQGKPPEDGQETLLVIDRFVFVAHTEAQMQQELREQEVEPQP